MVVINVKSMTQTWEQTMMGDRQTRVLVIFLELVTETATTKTLAYCKALKE